MTGRRNGASGGNRRHREAATLKLQDQRCCFSLPAFADFAKEHAKDVRQMARQLGAHPDEILSEIFLALAAPAVAAGAVGNVTNWVFRRVRTRLERQFRPAGFVSLDEANEQGITLGERIVAQEVEPSIWQKADAEGMVAICNALEGGTAALAKRLGVTRRRGQQIFREAANRIQGDLFAGGANVV